MMGSPASATKWITVLGLVALVGAQGDCGRASPPPCAEVDCVPASHSPYASSPEPTGARGASFPVVSQSLTIETGDIDETGPFPLPLTAKTPLGSLIYDPTVSGTIASVADADDFESGSLGPQWATSSSTPQGRIQVTGAFGTARGAFALLMDTAVSAPNNGNEAIWTVDLSGEDGCAARLLACRLQRRGESPAPRLHREC